MHSKRLRVFFSLLKKRIEQIIWQHQPYIHIYIYIRVYLFEFPNEESIFRFQKRKYCRRKVYTQSGFKQGKAIVSSGIYLWLKNILLHELFGFSQKTVQTNFIAGFQAN